MTCPVTGKTVCHCRRMKLIRYSILIAIVINLLVPCILKPFAKPYEIKPPNGAGSLSFKSQLMHMFVHHAQVPISSSVIIAIIVGIATYVATKYA